jgi:hypothetical protein
MSATQGYWPWDNTGSDIRAPELVPAVTPGPLFTFAEVKAWFGLTESVATPQTTAAMNAVSKAIRDYCGRYISLGSYTETFVDVIDEKATRHLIETPVSGTLPAGLLNRNTGLIRLTGGPSVPVTYTGGYSPIPDDLKICFMALLQQQMALFGVDPFGNSKPVGGPQERAVTVGTLKVEYAVSNQSDAAGSATAVGAITEEALVPWDSVLGNYRAARKYAST